MWWQDFKDKGHDDLAKEIRLEPGKGFSGCEMNESCGWGETDHHYRRNRRGILRQVWSLFFGSKVEG